MSHKTKKHKTEDDVVAPEAVADEAFEAPAPVEAELAPEIAAPTPPPTWQDLVGSVEEQAAPADDPIVQLVNEYKEAIKARDAAEDRYLRAAAEFANARRRAEMRADHEVRSARERLLGSVLPVVDDFERAFQAVPADAQGSTWVEGFALIQRKLQGILQREGVTPIDAQGHPFDATRHQAVLVEAVDDVPSGTVIDVLQQGYLLDERVLRPAMVKVSA
jgi:molecular chaperone GrpE